MQPLRGALDAAPLGLRFAVAPCLCLTRLDCAVAGGSVLAPCCGTVAHAWLLRCPLLLAWPPAYLPAFPGYSHWPTHIFLRLLALPSSAGATGGIRVRGLHRGLQQRFSMSASALACLCLCLPESLHEPSCELHRDGGGSLARVFGFCSPRNSRASLSLQVRRVAGKGWPLRCGSVSTRACVFERDRQTDNQSVSQRVQCVGKGKSVCVCECVRIRVGV